MNTTIALRSMLRRGAAASRAVAATHRYNSTRNYSSTVHENDPKTLGEEKARNLAGKQHQTSTTHEHAPGWNEYLASASEAHVKADQSNVTVEELTQTTIEHVKKRHHDEDGVGSVEAAYEKDEVTGPLKGATEARHAPKDEVEGPLKGAKSVDRKKPRPTDEAKDLGHLQGKSVEKNTTASEDAVRADRGDI